MRPLCGDGVHGGALTPAREQRNRPDYVVELVPGCLSPVHFEPAHEQALAA